MKAAGTGISDQEQGTETQDQGTGVRGSLILFQRVLPIVGMGWD